MTSERVHWLLSPSKYLAAVNIASAGIGFAQGLIVARVLGAEGYGVIAVIAGTNMAVLNFLDVRLSDLAAKLYYKPTPEAEAKTYRASVLQICLIGNGLISLALCGLGLLANLLLIGFFTSTAVQIEWLVIQALVLAISNWANTFAYLQRFSGRFYLMGTGALVNRIATIVLFLAIFSSAGDITGYYRATLLSQSLGLWMAGGLGVLTWEILEQVPFIRRFTTIAWKDYRRETRFLFYGNLLGYVKMLHRTTDVLLIGLFAGDRVTGLYKFTRSLTDALYVLYDALNQVYYPALMQLLSQKARDAYRHLAKRLFLGSGAFTLVTLTLEALFLVPMLQIVLANRFAGSESAIIVMTIPFIFVTGVSTWLWPLYVHSGRLGRFTVYALLASLVQYTVTISLAWLWGPTPLVGALGYLSYYLILFPLAYFTARHSYISYLPGLRGQRIRV